MLCALLLGMVMIDNSFLFANYEVHFKSIQFLFTMILSLSCSMYQMIVFQILDIFDAHSRYLIMSACLYTLILFILLVVPTYWFYFVVSAANATSKAFRSGQSWVSFHERFCLWSLIMRYNECDDGTK